MNDGPRRIIALDVNELSIVDHPAIERTFLVTKRQDVEKAVWSTAQINDLPDSAFLHIEDGGKKDSDGKTTPRSLRHFPVKGPGGAVDLPHLRNALARIPQSSLPAEVKDRATAHARSLLANQKQSAQKAVDGEIAKCAAAGALTPETKATVKAVVPWLHKMADEATGAGQVALMLSAELLEKIHGGAMSTGTGTQKAMTDEEKKKAEKEAAEKAQKEAAEKAKAKPSSTETEPGGSGTEDLPDKGEKVARTKAVAQPMMMWMSDGTVQEVVSKAGKRKYLTAGRMGAVADMTKQGLKLLKEADAELYKAIIREVDGQPVDPMNEGEQPDLPRDPTVPPSEVRPYGLRGNAMYEEKTVAETITAAVTKALEPVTARLEKIEKARAPSASLPEGPTDTPTQTDVKKAFWGGVL